MSKRLGTLVTAIATFGLVLLSTEATFGEVRDHRNNAGQTYVGGRGGGGCYNCATSTASGGVVVSQGGKVVPTKVAPPPSPPDMAAVAVVNGTQIWQKPGPVFS